ncbi:TRAP transporter fused permease subunit [Candidatus Poribacteria bacterium]|nr:TRAP transporter fused permease subunit [Candidatus Poribacteria bacterium]
MPDDLSVSYDEIGKYDPEFRFRKVKGIAAIIVTVIACGLSIFHVYTAGFGALMDMKHRSVHLTVTMLLIFLLYPARYNERTKVKHWIGDGLTALVGTAVAVFGLKEILNFHIAIGVPVFLVITGFIIYTMRVKFYRQKHIPYIDIIMALAGAVVSIYIFVNYEGIVSRSGLPTNLDLIFGLSAILLVMEATRRTIGWDLPVLAFLCLIYAYFGPYMPGFLSHRGYSVKRIIEHMYLGTEGIYGIPLGVVATYVFHFVLFGIFVAKTGLGQLFIDIAMALAGRSKGGPAKVAIISSGLLGSINGSSIANTVTTGSFTIPLMKRMGYSSRFAGAVEATASTGGQITPPIMGAAAFIMSEMIGMPYIKIAAAAAIPALLHYLGIGTMVHLQAAKEGLKGIPKEDLPDIKRCLIDRGHLLIPLVAVIYLLITGRSPFLAAFWGITSSILVSYLRKETRLSLREIIEALEWGTRSSLSITAACACVGFIVGTATLTGLGLSFASMTVNLAKSTAGFFAHLDFFNLGFINFGNLFFTLLYTMAACTILGSGLPTTATYIILSMIAAPALRDFNIPLLVSHMFVLYYGVLADVTPPVALAAYAGAGLAGSNPFRTGFTAFKLALAEAIVPFAFVYTPMFLLLGFEWKMGIIHILSVALGIVALGAGAVGYLSGRLAVWERVLMITSTILLIVPSLLIKGIGAVLFFLLVFYQKIINTLRNNNRF